VHPESIDSFKFPRYLYLLITDHFLLCAFRLSCLLRQISVSSVRVVWVGVCVVEIFFFSREFHWQSTECKRVRFFDNSPLISKIIPDLIHPLLSLPSLTLLDNEVRCDLDSSVNSCFSLHSVCLSMIFLQL
jgi:hypothetical protein